MGILFDPVHPVGESNEAEKLGQDCRICMMMLTGSFSPNSDFNHHETHRQKSEIRQPRQRLSERRSARILPAPQPVSIFYCPRQFAQAAQVLRRFIASTLQRLNDFGCGSAALGASWCN
ncbi:MAG: hypothetical protein HZA90_18055 [Verrucomicrobia bacterium]|nr:hypothetical protein [Verrucomicrobiota bacterium]